MKYSTVIFDFDYTLADATNGIVSSFNYAFNQSCAGAPRCKQRGMFAPPLKIPLKEIITLNNLV
jgi:phosphoglycolate phosphatase-like HAD superfamily hydrolase